MALEIWDDVAGRIIMNGVPYMALDAHDTVQFLYSCVIDDLVSAGASRNEVREEVDKKIAEVTMIYNDKLRRQAREDQAAGKPVDVTNVPEAEPFVLTPQMQQALGIPIYGGEQ